MNSDARSEIKKVCNIETRYEEVQKEVYSHSTITFWSGGKQYTLRFKKIMNIFYLHEDPQVSAKMHCDKHVVKMIIEYAQMLSTAHRMLDGKVVKKPSVSGKTMVKHYDLYEGMDDLEGEMTYYSCSFQSPMFCLDKRIK